MSRRSAAIASSLTTVVLLAVAAAAQQPRLTNGRLTPHPGDSLAQTIRSLMATESEIVWIGYAVPVRDRDRTMCCWSNASGTTYISGTMSSSDAPCCGSCRIEPAAADAPGPAGTAPRTQGPVKLEGAEHMMVLLRIVDQQVERVRTFSEDCEIDAGGRQVHWLEKVRPADSVSFLEALLSASEGRKSRVTNAALQAISLHADAGAAPAIERLARAHASGPVRGEALFWLAQMAGAKVAGTITAAIENDPDTEVKRRAVFALSQLPKNEGVPLLIEQARKNRNPVVRKQAVFWLGQSKDPRALEFFAEILK